MSINYLDLAVLLIIVLSILFGFKKGFLRTVTGLAAMVISLILAMTLYPYTAELIMKTPVYDTVYDNTAAVIQVPQENTGRLSDFGTGKLNLPRDFTNHLEKNIDTASDAVASSVANTVASSVVKLVSMLCVFVLARFLLMIVAGAAGLIHKLPIIGWGDSLLGALFGLFRGLLFVYVLLAFVTFAASMAPDGALSRAIKYSEFAKVMYNDNVLLDFIYKG